MHTTYIVQNNLETVVGKYLSVTCGSLTFEKGIQEMGAGGEGMPFFMFGASF